MALDENVKKTILKYTLLNAVQYGGTANIKAVMGKVFSEHRELKSQARLILQFVREEVERINKMTLEEQKELLNKISPELLEPVHLKKEKKMLPPLPNVEKYPKVIMRLAPYPSGPLHIGNARMVVLNDEYVKKYNGELILAFDDTIGSEEKVIVPEAYELIKEGLEWLGVEWHRTIYKSDRVPIFYKYGKQLIEMKKAYVCNCNAEEFRTKYKINKRPCPHRNLTVEENLERWEKMLDGTYEAGEAVVRLKTSMSDPNPAIRDPVILRISDREHPRVGTKYRVWPLLEFNWAIDDHLLGVTHILRGKDLIKEDIIEQFVWDIFDWPYVEFIHYGRIMFKGISLSKTKSRKLIEKGIYFGWTDPRTWSLQSLAARGIKPDALRATLLDLGLSMTDIEFSPEHLYACNRKMIDKDVNRLFFVANPVEIKVINIPQSELISRIYWHPDFPERGVRFIKVIIKNNMARFFISETDWNNFDVRMLLRFKSLMNVEIIDKENRIAKYHSLEPPHGKGERLPIIQWIPALDKVPTRVLMPNGEIISGFAEMNIYKVKVNEVVQFERFGFVKIHKNEKNNVFVYYGHP